VSDTFVKLKTIADLQNELRMFLLPLKPKVTTPSNQVYEKQYKLELKLGKKTKNRQLLRR
jgi:hypothetical protein